MDTNKDSIKAVNYIKTHSILYLLCFSVTEFSLEGKSPESLSNVLSNKPEVWIVPVSI